MDDRAPRGGILLDLIRVLYESPAGADREREARVGRVHAYLATLSDNGPVRTGLPGGAAAITQPEDDVPLPFDAATWTRLTARGSRTPSCLLAALLSDRRAALLYHGLVSVDEPTRAYLSSIPSLPGKLIDGIRPSVIATLGRSIRVRDGRMDVPGGAPAVPMWEGLLDRRVSEPEGFILELLQRDRGRLAVLYDAIDHLDPPRQAFALGLHTPGDAGPRIERFKALYAAFCVASEGLDIEARPFRRATSDGVRLLSTVRVLPSGTLPPPAGRRFWQATLRSWELPSDAVNELSGGDGDGDADAAWLVEHVCVRAAGARQPLLETWTFGQRVFALIPASAYPSALVALRGYTRFRTLLLTLERAGITDPEVFAVAVRHAQHLGAIRGRGEAVIALRQFQGALSLVERLRFSRAVSAEAASRLIRSLVNVPLSDRGEYEGRIGAWLDEQLLAALPPAPLPPSIAPDQMGPAEGQVLAAIAGLATPPPTARVEWEGLPYRVDIGGAEFARLSRVRWRQGGAGLDAVLAYGREVRRLTQDPPSPGTVPARIAALSAATDGLERVRETAGVQDPPAPRLRGLMENATRDLRSIKRPGEVAKARDIAVPLRRAGDWWLGSVLIALAYAPHLGDPDAPALLAGDPAQRHDFGTEASVTERQILNPWRLPQQQLGAAGGWRVAGSLLGLDVGLAALGLRRAATDSLPPRPLVNDIDRSALSSSAAFSNPFDVTDADRDALADAIRRGRARVAGLPDHPSALPQVVRASSVGEWRRQLLPWALEREPERLQEYFSLGDLARIGAAEATPLPPLDAWGTSALSREGCLCLRLPPSGNWETSAGRSGTALVTEQVPDLALRIAEALATLGLPARLLRPVLAVATQDVLDTYRPAYIDDWAGLVAAVRRLSDVRLTDAIAVLTSGGPLVPADEEHSDDARR